MLNKIIYSDGMLAKMVAWWIEVCDFRLGRWDELVLPFFIAEHFGLLMWWIRDHSQYTVWNAIEALSFVPFVLLFRFYARRKATTN